ncbi:MAG: cation diffusion facilitator family transporter [Fluviicola sp.]
MAFFLNLAFTVFEFLGGLYTNSIALTSDALHDVGDSFALGSAWYLENLSKRKPDKKFTFGYARFSLLGALINSIILIVGSIFIIWHGVERLIHPEETDAAGMIFFAIVGVVVNSIAAWRLMGGKTLNEQVMSWHLLEDVLGWVAILIAAIVMYFKDVPFLDPALSLFIAGFILFGVFKRLRQTLLVFLQVAPSDIDLVELELKIKGQDHVQSIHDCRIWSLEGEQNVFTVHVLLENISTVEEVHEVRMKLLDVLKPYNFKHITIQTEFDPDTCFA